MNALSITNVRFDGEYCVELAFSDDRSGTVDFRSLLGTDLPPAFNVLRDPSALEEFQLRDGTLHWPGDLDLAPEYLYFCAFEADRSLHERFAEWGYLQTT